MEVNTFKIDTNIIERKYAKCIRKITFLLLFCYFIGKKRLHSKDNEKCIKLAIKLAYVKIVSQGTKFCIVSTNEFFLPKSKLKSLIS